MEHFAPFTTNTAPIRYETMDLESSMTLVEDALRVRNEGIEPYELDGRSYGLENLHEMPIPNVGGPGYAYTELPTRPSTTGPGPVNDASSPPPRSYPRTPNRSAAGISSTLNIPFDAFDTPEFYWNNPTATAIPSNASQPQPPRPPRRRFRPTESPQFLPEYVIDNFLKANPDQDGFFCVFRKTYVLKSDGKTVHEGHVPSNQTTLWTADKVLGHLFEVTWWGSMIYHGPFQDNERDFTTYWGRKSAVKELREPILDTHYFFHIPENYIGDSSSVARLELLPELKAKAVANVQFKNSPEFAIFQGTELSTLLSETAVGRAFLGSWRRIFAQSGYTASPSPQQSSKLAKGTDGHLTLFSNVPKLIAQIVSTGKVHPSQIFRYISLSKMDFWVCFKLYCSEFLTIAKYRYPTISLRIPLCGWKDEGWMYTELGGMDVLIA